MAVWPEQSPGSHGLRGGRHRRNCPSELFGSGTDLKSFPGREGERKRCPLPPGSQVGAKNATLQGGLT